MLEKILNNKPNIEFLPPNKMPIWLGKLLNYEYWPTWFFYIPIGFYVLYLMVRSRSITYFTNVNPSIKDSGIIRYSKFGILEHISDNYKPKGVLLNSGSDVAYYASQFTFPLIAKPDMGERGKGVTMISNIEALKQYAAGIKQDFILQEYCDFHSEGAIFYVRKPSEEKGRITSFTTKEFLSVQGDGIQNISQLMSQSFRARLQIYRQDAAFLNQVPDCGQVVIIENIGNHNRGTKFINSNHLISEKLLNVFDGISKQIDGFYFGRYDLKFNDINDLENGKNFKIVELNGINSEPVHIYDQQTGLFNAYKDCFNHMKLIFEISEENKSKGFKRTRGLKFWNSIFFHINHRKLIL